MASTATRSVAGRARSADSDRHDAKQQPPQQQQQPTTTTTSLQQQQQSVTSDYERALQRLTEEIASLRKRVDALRSMLDTMRAADSHVFDEEDTEWVESTLALEQQRLTTLEQDYDKRVNYYNNVLVSMREVVDVRQRTLESLDAKTHVLRDHPDLMDRLVKKQVVLKNLYQEIATQLTQ